MPRPSSLIIKAHHFINLISKMGPEALVVAVLELQRKKFFATPG